MNENQALLGAWDQIKKAKIRSALATIIRVTGSSYRRAGAKMLVTEDGEIFGRVSGGCLERDLILRAQNALNKSEHTIVIYDTSQDADDSEAEAFIRSAGLGCEGVIEIFIDPFPGRVLSTLALSHGERRTLVMATHLKDKPDFQFSHDGVSVIDGLLPSLALRETMEHAVTECIRNKKSILVDVKGERTFLDVILPPQELLIFGAGHDAVAMARLGYELGFHTRVIDTRSSFPVPRRHFANLATLVQCAPEAISQQVSISKEACVVVMTHNIEHDQMVLSVLLEREPRYIGLLGPRSRANKIFSALKEKGIYLTEPLAQRIYSPIGLDIGGDGPMGIALAVMSEIQSVIAGRKAGFLRERVGSIH